MTLFLTIVALLGLIIFAVGGVLFLVRRPPEPPSALIMVIGALVFAIAQIFLLFDAIF